MFRGENRGQTNVDFAVAGLLFTLFVSSTILAPTSPLFSFENTDIDHQVRGESETVRLEQELKSDDGEITTDDVCNIAEPTIAADGIQANLTFEPIGNQSYSELERNGCDTSYGPTPPPGGVTTTRKTIIVDGELTQLRLSMWGNSD